MLIKKYLNLESVKKEGGIVACISCIWTACKDGGIVPNKYLKWSISNEDFACLWGDFWLSLGLLMNQIEPHSQGFYCLWNWDAFHLA